MISMVLICHIKNNKIWIKSLISVTASNPDDISFFGLSGFRHFIPQPAPCNMHHELCDLNLS